MIGPAFNRMASNSFRCCSQKSTGFGFLHIFQIPCTIASHPRGQHGGYSCWDIGHQPFFPVPIPNAISILESLSQAYFMLLSFIFLSACVLTAISIINVAIYMECLIYSCSSSPTAISGYSTVQTNERRSDPPEFNFRNLFLLPLPIATWLDCNVLSLCTISTRI